MAVELILSAAGGPEDRTRSFGDRHLVCHHSFYVSFIRPRSQCPQCRPAAFDGVACARDSRGLRLRGQSIKPSADRHRRRVDFRRLRRLFRRQDVL